MIDVENQIFTTIYNAVITEYPNAKIESALNLSPSKFPCVSIEEVDNQNLLSTIDSGSNENHVTVTYEVTVWSNLTSGRKAEAKAILAIADDILINLNFSRITRTPIQLDDGTKYRLLARYTAIIDKNETVYRR